jgi:hypothetical protein
MDKIKLLAPQRYKRMLFEALIEMLSMDLISFTETYDNKGYLTFNETKDNDEVNSKIYSLSFEEEMALRQIDLAKEELVNIYRFESTNGNCRYDLAPDKANKMNDDRAYTIAMLAWYLQELRRKNITQKKKPSQDLSGLFLFKQPKIR